MKRFAIIFSAFFILIMAACTKTSTNSNNINSSTSLLPLKAGNYWIYQDSSFDASGNLQVSAHDSTFINKNTTSVSGVTFYGITDSIGWFGTGGYVTVDPSNTYLYGLDSLNAPNYLFFALAPGDGYLIGSSTDYSNPACLGTYALYGFASTYKVNGYTCYRSYGYYKDCNNNILNAYIYYVCPGVGIVRIEDYLANPNVNTNTLYMDYSQTLQSYKLN